MDRLDIFYRDRSRRTYSANPSPDPQTDKNNHMKHAFLFLYYGAMALLAGTLVLMFLAA